MHRVKELVRIFQATEAFRDLSQSDLEELATIATLQVHAAKEKIIQEHDEGDHVYLLKSGSAEVIKMAPEGPIVIATLGPGDWFGERALIDAQRRSASVCATELTEVVSFPVKQVKQLTCRERIEKLLLQMLSKQTGERLRTTNTLLVDGLRRELEVAKLNQEVGRSIIYIFILIAIFVYVLKILTVLHLPAALSHFFNSILIFILGVYGVLTIKTSAYPLSFFGISLKGWMEHARVAAVLTLPLLVLMTILKWVLVHYVDAYSTLNVIGPGNHVSWWQQWFSSTPNYTAFWVASVLYVLLVPLQELVVRGCIQGFLAQFFQSSKLAAFKAIIVSNILFATFHNVYGFDIIFSFIAGSFGLFWGWLYYKQKTLVGPIVSHALVGLWGLCILDYGAVF